MSWEEIGGQEMQERRRMENVRLVASLYLSPTPSLQGKKGRKDRQEPGARCAGGREKAGPAGASA